MNRNYPKLTFVFDGRGRINWHQTEGLIVVTREDVSKTYIEQLENNGIRYILAGTGKHIDLSLALEKLYDIGFQKLGLSGGGSIKGVFLRQGLIDEISLVLAPLAVGGRQTPSIFDSEELESLDGVTQLELLNTRPIGEQGAIRLHYRVRK
ncbi:dihydrofolate reductase family protein [Alkalihalobacillus sp. AL-G]|uniref:RibD family protein n=1 Tax=Alkalihalobacillus sp. AL-G TaxID=2926399 RepID=UPI00272A1832|nr:dihydrofolate reductase family protein [Alkalihalobacillus sp. AL-G]WLD94391.1 dihydrofolate reductase family protein [Alkalihalobacillus sp. AL-G]